jgi:hypothetical protein
VKDRAKWDSKHEIRRLMRGESIILRDERGYDWYEYSIPGNVHFGFVGRAAGFSGFELHGGAGYAEITDPAHDEGSYCCPNYCKGPIHRRYVKK